MIAMLCTIFGALVLIGASEAALIVACVVRNRRDGTGTAGHHHRA